MSQKTARVARKQHECGECSGAILPGEVYLNEHGQRSSYDLRFVNKHTCALCVMNGVRRPAPTESLAAVAEGYEALVAGCVRELHVPREVVQAIVARTLGWTS